MKSLRPGTAEPQFGSVSQPAPLGWYSRGYLPHHDEIHRLQSITFRLADSLPQAPLDSFEEQLRLAPESNREQERRKYIESWLDRGVGCCALRHPVVSQMMLATLQKFDGTRYRLIA